MYQVVYKCRLCGEVFYDKKNKAREVKDFTMTNILAQVEQSTLMKKPNNVDLHMAHNCVDGSCGFADFQGFKKVEE